MRSITHAVTFAALTSQALGIVHHMFSGVFSGTDIYAIEFDDETNNLTLASGIVSNANSSKWIAIDVCETKLIVGKC